MKNKTIQTLRSPLLILLCLLSWSFAVAQVGINRLPVNTTLKVGNDTLNPVDTLVLVLDENDQMLLGIERDGNVLMPKLDTGATSYKLLTQNPDGSIVVREVDSTALDGDDGVWTVTADLIHDLDSHIIIQRGANPAASITINKPGVYSVGEEWIRGSTSHTLNDYFSIHSGTSANNYLYPTFKGHVEGGYGYTACIMGETVAALDTGTAAMVRFDARRTNNRIFNRHLFQWVSYQATWMTLTADGWLGIGTSTPSAQLEITGDAIKPGGGSWTGASDRRLKQDIREFEDGLDVLMQINPVWFQYNGKANMPTDKTYVGIIAQEMEKIAPYTVSAFEWENEAGEVESYLKYDGNSTTYILINAVQEQQALIEAQSDRISNLESQLQTMQENLDQVAAHLDLLSNQTAKR